MSIGLADNLRLRVDRNGGAILNVGTLNVHFFNQSALKILLYLREPRTSDELRRAVGFHNQAYSILCDFVADCLKKGILEKRTKTSNVEIYDFTPDDEIHTDFQSPIGCEVEITLKCMRRCKYCAYDSGPAIDTTKNLAASEWAAIFDRLRALGVFALRITGGDPLTYPGLIELLHSESDRSMQITVASDLTLFDESIIHQLSGIKNVIALKTTLDGSTPAIADALRGRGNFRRVTTALKRLARGSLPVIVGTVVSKTNYSDIYNVATLISNLGITRYSISELYESGRARELSLLVPSESEIRTAELHFYKAWDEGLIEPVNPIAEFHLANSEQSTTIARPRTSTRVTAPTANLRVDPRGKVYVSVKTKAKYGEETYLGDALRDDMISLWQRNRTLIALRRAALHDKRFLPSVPLASLPDIPSPLCS